MFELLEGQEALFQWDLNRRLVCQDDTITQIHFYKNKNEVLTVERKEAEIGYYFEVPNILLQISGNLRVYGYNGEATLFQQQFQILPRPKPSDYVYTETELFQVEEFIEQQFKEILKYLEDHPPKDGVSPTISVTNITNGHRVAITDAEGTHTFDVMNGDKGDNYVLTETDKNDIANIVMSNFVNVAEVGR